MEGGAHGEDRLSVLDGHHTAGGEAAAVADTVDLVDDRHRGVAGTQEIGMQRMREAALDRANSSDQRLPDHLPAEHPVSYTHLRAHETKANLVCRLLLE